MAEGPRAPLLRAVSGAPMGETIPPESKDQLTADRDDDYAHEAVTIAPPAPNFEDLLRQRTPPPSLSFSRREQPFHAALDAGARAGSSLSELSKIVSELSSGLMGAKQANENLVRELGTLRGMLSSASEQQLNLKQRLSALEQELTSTKDQAEQERQFLAEQHDDFVSALLEEHEEALRDANAADAARIDADVSHLTQKLVHTEAARLLAEAEQTRAREALAKAHAQRDEAQARAEKLERERDELRAEASQLRARLGTHRSASTVPPPPVVSRPPSFHPPPALQLDAGELDSTLHASPRLPSVRPRLTPAPAELRGAVVSSARPPIPRSLTPGLPRSLTPAVSRAVAPGDASAEPVTSSKTAREFPHESTRPGVGGPKPTQRPKAPNFGPPPSGWTPVPPPPEPAVTARPVVVSAASMPPSVPGHRPALKQKPDPATRPLIDYSLGGDGLPSETLEGVRLNSKPPRK
jgi:hypothetical protein